MDGRSVCKLFLPHFDHFRSKKDKRTLFPRGSIFLGLKISLNALLSVIEKETLNDVQYQDKAMWKTC